MEIGIVAAVSANGVIGNNGKLPWPHIKADMERMHSIIDGHSIIVGRNTRAGIPDNWNVNYFTVSSQLAMTNRGELSMEDSIKASMQRHPQCNIYALGGTRIFSEAFRFATKLYLTRVNCEYHGDTYFPRIPSYWALTSKEDVSEQLTFLEYENVFTGGVPVPVGVY